MVMGRKEEEEKESKNPEDHDCDVCGANAFMKCPKCGNWYCSICIRNPCKDFHYDYDEEEKGSDEDPNYTEKGIEEIEDAED